MTFSAISDKSAIIAAINECDSIGRDHFLKKYGFKPATKYFLLYKGGRYDSKAILGVAHAYQFPQEGHLAHRKFSGGEVTVAKKLRKLGFEISSVGFMSREPLTWAFCSNPKIYRIGEAVKHLEIDYWTIGRSDVRAGDKAVIWQTNDSEGHRGVVAFAKVLENPKQLSDDTNPYWADNNSGSEIKARVPVSYSLPRRGPLWVDKSESGEFLRSLSVARAQGGTVFKVTDEQWTHLLKLADHDEISDAEIEEKVLRSPVAHGKGGQGFGLSANERKVVEEYSMKMASNYFKENWDNVDDVSARCSFDLLCKTAPNELRVEVKGTTTHGDQIILTYNEVRESNMPDYALFVVSEIEIDRSDTKHPKASGGIARLFYPWSVQPGMLKPINYMCSLDRDQSIIVD